MRLLCIETALYTADGIESAIKLVFGEVYHSVGEYRFMNIDFYELAEFQCFTRTQYFEKRLFIPLGDEQEEMKERIAESKQLSKDLLQIV